MLYDNLLQTIGNTPLVRLNSIKAFDGESRIYAKVEFFNPGGSIKDRAGLYMLEKAKEDGKINDKTVIIEPTSGNTGIGLALYCAVNGMKLMLTMPENMSVERVKLLKAYGAEIILTDKGLGMSGAIQKAKELHGQLDNSFIPMQFDNNANALAHYETTAKEIFEDLKSVKAIVAGVGTGGTLMGIAKYVKDNHLDCKIIAVEPERSAVLSGKEKGAHNLQGIGAGFVPSIVDLSLIDEIVTESEQNAYTYARKLAKEEGMLVGITSGASLSSAVRVSEKIKGDIVVILPDTGMRYLSTELYE